MPTSLLLMLCTAPDRGTAERLAGMLVEQELAACVNLSAPITSIYRWQGKTEQSEEVLLLIKTTKDRYQACESALRAEHPYELPEIIAVPVEQGLDDYVNWVERCTNQSN
ncbi:MAG: divalent-cation tolerance protein CutA [Candidatus Thiodiazotropha lotti]|uniref:Cation tolerance protein CutA n=1 Tax=Candidatus Thiodiazotropha endoloripes TaxID=1818881 RepID=A0A1E2UM11_9GAMM|nr:divalent-cation tolerance protein CutA [Candidatus Thiodiazotropha endoloripes]MCG7900034.1 divalent-cation tolerance protein CutA [Candidatus Thiodiazotropha weberae]MCG7991754.1 divalent-cation tolerance protein CutA [Candidatus Thiodiazotropha lotti]MCG7903650.1 divalent-cation tolerance protein CutA [Candidatus Thiodiazotropha weberae]MCG7913114.1 divalent-cation tolerance protein CutA [Candidatus Thiodiazotropha weberae]MCG8000518.1 divalent-cation tolerance protein CutA [Candidatus Th